MTLTFFSNFFNHHQKPVADELYAMLGNDYKFVATTPIPENFLKGGYPDYSDMPYIIHAYEDKVKYNEALLLGLQSDIVILGAAPEIFIEERLKLNKHTFRYSERIFRKGKLQKFNPRALYMLYNLHTKFRNKNYYLLAASAFTANDLNWVFAYPEKMYKWGYFTNTFDLNIEKLLTRKRNTVFTILFVARLIKLKHPEMAIEMAKRLKMKGIQFKLNIIGTGDMEDALKNSSKEFNLEEEVTFFGNIPNEQVNVEMRKANVLLFPSNHKEGWGAVVNEAMANGCTVLASHKIGSVPFLIKPGINGSVFESENIKDLTVKIIELKENRQLCEQLAINAYETITKTWSPKAAATNLLNLSRNKLNNKNNASNIEEGPCSKATSTSNIWQQNIIKTE
ncbi:glycosyltransferase [Maribacter dokdonensis]|uniref:glycosyltransferase n=1 Tax=Maribacter dokdonensis TaxID=320912 RepID=UPI002AB0F601|nr:glycosyltransferase [Maribacter dokdonensis]